MNISADNIANFIIFSENGPIFAPSKTKQQKQILILLTKTKGHC